MDGPHSLGFSPVAPCINLTSAVTRDLDLNDGLTAPFGHGSVDRLH